MYMETAETGVAVLAEVISEGNVLDTGVDSLPSCGLVAEGMLAVCLRLVNRTDVGQRSASRSIRIGE
jgi:hypothetical protein